MTTTLSPSYDIGTEWSAVSVADEVTFATATTTTQVYSLLSLPSTIHDELLFAIIMNTTAFHEMPSAFHIGIIAANNDAVSYPAVMVEPYNISYESPSAIIMKTTASYTSHSMQPDTSVIVAQSSAGITKSTTLYALPSAVKMVTTDTNTAVYFAVTVIDAQSSAGITKITTLYILPSDVMVKTIPYESNTDERTSVITTSLSVSTADKATSSVNLSTCSTDVALKTYATVYGLYFESIFKYFLTSYESLSTDIMKTTEPYTSHFMQRDIYLSPSVLYDLCEYSCYQFNQITLVLSTLLSLYRALHLIITSLLVLISNPYFDTISC